MISVLLSKTGLHREIAILNQVFSRFKLKYQLKPVRGKDLPPGEVVLLGGWNHIPSCRPIGKDETLLVRVPVIGKAQGDDLTKGASMTLKGAFIAGRVFSGEGLDYDIPYTVMPSRLVLKNLNKLPQDAMVWFDFETTGLDPSVDEIVTIGLAVAGQMTVVTNYGDVTPVLDWLVTSPNPKGVCNATFEQQWFWEQYKKLANITVDVQVDHCLTNEEDYHSLDMLAGLVDMFGYDYEMEAYRAAKENKVDGKKCPHHLVPQEILYNYSAADPYVTKAVGGFLDKKLKKEPIDQTEVRSWLMRGQNMLARVMRRGMSVDKEFLLNTIKDKKQTEIRLTRKLQKLAEKYGMPDFNPGSAPQKSKLLYEKLGLPVISETTTGGSTAEKVLEKLLNKKMDSEARGAVKCIVELSKLSSAASGLLSRCLSAVQQGDGRMRSSLSLTKLLTGQLSSSEPPMQNVHKTTIRRIFNSRFKGGTMQEYDYRQLHLMIMGNLAQCAGFIDAYENDIDLHARTTALVILGCDEQEVLDALAGGSEKMEDHRHTGKQTNFSIIFEIGAKSLSERTGVPVPECKRIIWRFLNEAFPEVREQIERQHHFATKHGYVISPMGRVRHLPDARSKDRQLKFRALRQAGDYLISNSGRYITLYAMILMDEYMVEKKMQSGVVMQVHDSIMVDAHPSERYDIPDIAERFMVEAMMEYCADWMTPISLVVDGFIGPNWYKGDAEEKVELR